MKDVSFSEDGKYFVTCGVDHLKYWDFDDNDEPIKTPAPSDGQETELVYMMDNTPADVTKVDAKDFVGVVCRNNYSYTLTADGKL